MNPSINPSASLLGHFESIDDPRTEYLIEHQMLDLIAITICAVICGAESWVEIEEYGYSLPRMVGEVFGITEWYSIP